MGDQPLILVHKDGDVILKPGKGDASITSAFPEVRLRVSSQVLGVASPVFAAMFNGRFSEGQNLSSASPKEIDLPDDHGKLVTWLVRILHFKTADIPGRVCRKDVVQFGLLCDKYDCIQAVRPWTKLWVSQLLAEPDAANHKDAEKLLAAAYILDLPEEFFKVTRMMVTDRTNPISVQTSLEEGDILPLMLLDHLQVERHNKFNEAMQSMKPKGFLKIGKPACKYGESIKTAYIENSNRSNLCFSRIMSLARIRTLVTEHFESIPQEASCRDTKCICQDPLRFSKNSALQSLDKCVNTTFGYCLDCVKRKANGNKEGECRIKRRVKHLT